MERRRGRSDIIAEILRIARSGANKTAVVYKSNTNFAMFDEYTKELKRAGMLSVDSGKIKTTSKGAEYLVRYYALKQLAV